MEDVRTEILGEVEAERERRRAEDTKKAKPEATPRAWAPSEKQMARAINRSDLGLAELFIESARGRYCSELDVSKKADGQKADVWYQFQGHRWVPDKQRLALREVMELGEHFERVAIAKTKEIQQYAKDSELPMSHPDIKELLKAVKPWNARAAKLREVPFAQKILKTCLPGEDGLGVTDEMWDQHPTLLCVANGVLDLETMKLHPGRPGQFLRQASPVEWHGAHVEAPFFEESLWRMMCYDAELVDYLDRVIGYAATGLVNHKQFWCAYGPTHDNGKSTFFETLAWVMGDMASTVPVVLLLENGKKGGGPDPELMKLQGLRMAVFSEPDKGSYFRVGTIKALTGGVDTISGRGLYADLVEFTNAAKLFLHTNYMPEIRGNDPAFIRRLRLIPFMAKFTKDRSLVDPARHIYLAENIKKVEAMFRREGPGILAYVARCAHRYLAEQDLSAPARVMAATDEYEAEQDLVGEWLNECCIFPEENWIQSKDLYDSFCYWCVTEKSIPRNRLTSNRRFGTELKGRFQSKRTNIVRYYGLKIRDEWQRSLDDYQGDGDGK